MVFHLQQIEAKVVRSPIFPVNHGGQVIISALVNQAPEIAISISGRSIDDPLSQKRKFITDVQLGVL